MISHPRALQLYSDWLDGKPVVRELTKADAGLPLYLRQFPQSSTLVETILLSTLSFPLMEHLLRQYHDEIGPIKDLVMSRCVRLSLSRDQLRRIWKLCRSPVEILLQGPEGSGVSFWKTALGHAITLHEMYIVSLFLQWGCALPSDVDLPAWVYQLKSDVDQARAHCRCAVIAFLIASRKGMPIYSGWREIAPLIARRIWRKRYYTEWI